MQALGCRDGGRMEKVAWRFWFAYDDAQCSIAHEKFGIRLYIDKVLAPTEEDATRLANVMISKLEKAQRLLEKRVLEPLALSELKRGHVIVKNQRYRLRDSYEYFREGAKLAIDGSGRRQRKNYLFDHQTEAFYNIVAMVNSYFSLLEHLLVLVGPFIPQTVKGEELLGFIGDRWSKKFKRIFDLNHDLEAKRFFDKFIETSEEYRNTFVHGGFDKSRGALGVYLPAVGWLPAMMTDIRESPHFDFVPADATDFDQICELFDAFDDWLKGSSASYGIQWAEAGLDVRFDSEFFANIVEAIDNDRLEQLMADTSYMVDMHENMDYSRPRHVDGLIGFDSLRVIGVDCRCR